MSQPTFLRPVVVTDDHLDYLDHLRDSGETNMYAATPFLRAEFDLEEDVATRILLYWIRSFPQRHSKPFEAIK